jgi:site-specific DNA recombinase
MLAGRFTAKTIKHEFIFRKYVTCKGCGYHLIGELQKGHVYYRCHTPGCAISMREEAIASVVGQKLDRLEFSLEEKAYLATRIQKLKANWVEEKGKQLTASNVKLQQVSDRLSRLTDAFLDGTIEKELFEERKTALLFEKRATEDQLNRLKDPQIFVPDTIQIFLELAGSPYSLYQSTMTDKKRRLLNIITSNFSASPECLDFAYAVPFDEVAEREKSIDGRPSKVVHRTLDKLLASLATKMEAMHSVTTALEPESSD